MPPITTHDLELLRAGGLDIRDRDLSTSPRTELLAAGLTELLQTPGYTAAEIATNNGVTAGRVRHWKLPMSLN